MIITCEECSTQFVLDDALVKPEGSKVRCSKCRHVFTAFPADRPEIEIPGRLEPKEQDLPFDEPEIQDDSGFDLSQDGDFSIESDWDSQDPDLEDRDRDIDFPEIEFDEPEFEQDPAEGQEERDAIDIQDQGIEIEDLGKDFDEESLYFETADFEIDEEELDFQDDGLKLDTQEFEFEEIENGTFPGPASLFTDSDTNTADIEISFDPDDGLDLSLEPAEALIDPPSQHQEEIIGEQPDLSIENDTLPSNDVTLASDDTEEPDDQEADEEIEQTASEQDEFAEYDKELKQETEPEETGITISDPEVENDTYPPETPLAPTDDEMETTTEELKDQKPLITPPFAQSVHWKRGSKKKKGGSLLVKILLVLFLMILAAYVAIIRLGVTIPVVSDIQIPFITEWLEPKQAPQPPLKPVPDEPSIDGRFLSNKSAGDLFIVTGRIKNPSNVAVSYIQVKGTLMTKDNTKAETLIAYCGNIVPEETLKSGNISDITKQMGVRQGNQNTNVNIKPGASVMFMLVFSNLPEDLANFTVAVQGFEPAQE